MKKNMGFQDKVGQLVLAVIIAALYFTHTITGTPGILLIMTGGLFVLTGFIGFCPLYLFFGIITRKKITTDGIS